MMRLQPFFTKIRKNIAIGSICLIYYRNKINIQFQENFKYLNWNRNKIYLLFKF